jgi:hypothetical protein
MQKKEVLHIWGRVLGSSSAVTYPAEYHLRASAFSCQASDSNFTNLVALGWQGFDFVRRLVGVLGRFALILL